MSTELAKEMEPGVIDTVNRRDVSPADVNWRWKGPDVRQGDRVAQAQERIRKHNQNDHSLCSPQACPARAVEEMKKF